VPRRAAALIALSLSGCGSLSTSELPPAAEPRVSPPQLTRPAGRVVRVGPPIGQLAADRTVSPGGAPEGLAFDPRSGVLAVGLRRPAELALLDGDSGRVLRRVGLPAGPRHLAVADGVFRVPAEMAGRVLAVRARDGRILSDVATGPQPHAVAVTGDGAVAVGNEGAASVGLFRGGSRTQTVPAALQPGGVIALDDGRYAVISVRERVVEVFGADGRRIAREPAGVGPTHGVYRNGVLWVTDTQGDALLVFQLEPELALDRRLRLRAGPYGIALDPVAERLWVTLTGSNRLVELPAHGRPHVLASYPTVRQPNDVAVDSRTGRVFVGGRADGVVQLLDPVRAQHAQPVGSG